MGQTVRSLADNGAAICRRLLPTKHRPTRAERRAYAIGRPGENTLKFEGAESFEGEAEPANYLVTCGNGTLTVTKPKSALLTGEISWAFLKATGTYFAQINVTCTNGVEAGVSDLKFMFADRHDTAGNVTAQLWSTPRHGPVSTCETFAGETYRVIPLDAPLIAEENRSVTFGVSNPSASTIPVEERTIELYVRKRVSPVTGNETAGDVENFVIIS